MQRIPLQRLLGDGGMATYVTAYNVYFVLLVLATAGFPSAIAKLVAEKYALGRADEGEAIRRSALRYALAAGVVATVAVFAAAPAISAINGDPDAALAIQALAPALLVFPWIAVERGYFHGRQRMGANGLSQIWEQILRVASSVLLAYVLLQFGFGLAWAAAGASFGGVLGAAAAAGVMLYYGAKLRKEEAASGAKAFAAASGGGDGAAAVPSLSAASGAGTGGAPSADASAAPLGPPSAAAIAASVDPSSTRSILRAIFKLSLPVSVTALAVPVVYLIDSLVTIPLLRGQLGAETAKDVLGMLQGRAQSLAGIPVIFAIALSQSILPIISGAFAKGDSGEVERQTSLALRMTLLSGVPVVAVLASAAFPLNAFIFGDADGSWIIVALVCSVVFQIVMMTSGSILLGLGRPEQPMKHIGVGIAVKLALSFLLAPFLGIYGIVAATAACFAVTMALNLRALRRAVRFRAMGGRAVPFAATALLQAAIGGAVAWAAVAYVRPFGSPMWDALLQTLLAAVAAGGAYPVLLMRTKAIAPEDVAALPGPLRKLWSRVESALRRLRVV